MSCRDTIDEKRHIHITDTNPLAILVKAALAEKDKRIDDLLRSNQELRSRAQLAEGRLKELNRG